MYAFLFYKSNKVQEINSQEWKDFILSFCLMKRGLSTIYLPNSQNFAQDHQVFAWLPTGAVAPFRESGCDVNSSRLTTQIENERE